MNQPRILFVHAHPDDESIGTGASMAKYAAEGAHVTLVTCTLGEEGEVIPEELRHLASDKEDRLGEHRIGELADACAALGVADHRFLGGAGRWRDSGMMGGSTNDDPRCFWRADVDEAAGELVKIIREVRPQVIVTYDERGNYGHPDHIQAHRVAWRAFELAADPAYPALSPGPASADPSSPPAETGGEPWQVAKFYAYATPRTVLARAIAVMREAKLPFDRVAGLDELGSGVPDDRITTMVDARPYLPAKLAALRAHRTQVVVAPDEVGPFFALSNGLGQQAFGTEFFILLAGERGPAAPGGRETDLFAGPATQQS
ncbi:N-acetyl-1-D-myo-inositol-2-amino-2-deoxy-alpha-D-glucopyranoside deacetylase [Actinomadura rudentiformis]|uniref:1D-myo-inositol 2-acetamido-2-deoxy-alpha-D-glucopyranoside deacetylase n=1 Tax=Actinomadura rudentiformis TaxID=359158 RepID=A0A6H9YBD0_9ACTN|nr:N-acetyl-1-D-myo-inositol-2-amino-2-deoxy-alpha-D-glucopyranoside deacetylase [Actinomadura rudentiformis]KAB2341263.1 N-acetyl-1-D-myo-inositol-2-amino-2-deoxy-alpha-D-glucopyranoside deacetylase [Actinomadura rudentiformis]